MHNQAFYKGLQIQAVEPISSAATNKLWADVGCSTGLLTRLAHKLNYRVTGFDIDFISILLARILSYKLNNINYKKEDLYTINTKFDIVSATSLLSVVDDEKEALAKLVSLLKDNHSILIIIEPTEKLSVKNTWKLINNLKTFWVYKGLLLWAIAREGKHVNQSTFETIHGFDTSKKYHLNGMVCITYISKTLNN